jgi:Outer membrane protein beta-barrel domain
MYKFAVLVSLIVLAPLVLTAQEQPKATVFGGYSYLRNGNSNDSILGGSNSLNGWEGQATYNFTPYLGVTADIGGSYRNVASFSFLPGVGASANQRLYSFLFGPTVTANMGPVSVFGHALFGEAHSSLGAGVNLPIIGGFSQGLTSANAFAMAFGGGIDIPVSRHFAIRAAQLDFVRTQFNSLDALSTGLANGTNGGQNSFRYSGGVVFRF